jgi:hypothetical protein
MPLEMRTIMALTQYKFTIAVVIGDRHIAMNRTRTGGRGFGAGWTA